MRNVTAIVILALLLAAVRSPAADPGTIGNGIAEPAQGYSSPRDAFNAMRSASDRKDWRTVFFSLTPNNQDAAVFGLFDSCTFCEEANAKVRAAMKRHGLELGKVFAEYGKGYRQKHGVDLDKLSAEAAKQPAPSLPPADGELLSKVVLKLVTDKAGFYAEASEAITPKVRDVLAPDYGNLEGLTVSRDVATGWVTRTLYHLKAEPGKPEVKEADPPERVQCCFRKLNGRWYNGE